MMWRAIAAGAGLLLVGAVGGAIYWSTTQSDESVDWNAKVEAWRVRFEKDEMTDQRSARALAWNIHVERETRTSTWFSYHCTQGSGAGYEITSRTRRFLPDQPLGSELRFEFRVGDSEPTEYVGRVVSDGKSSTVTVDDADQFTDMAIQLKRAETSADIVRFRVNGDIYRFRSAGIGAAVKAASEYCLFGRD